MVRHLTLPVGFLAIALATSSLTAQEERSFEERVAARNQAQQNDALHGRLGFGFTSQYFFRGIPQEGSGLITQPFIELNYDFIDSREGLQDLKLVFGQWNSLHSGRTGAGGAIWYESRFYVGLQSQFADRWQAGRAASAHPLSGRCSPGALHR